jgi:transposase-like protein
MHKNARLTPKGREVMLARLKVGQHQVDVAQAMGVSLTTVKKWWRRYRVEGPAGLLDRSSRPTRSPRQLPSTLRVEIADLWRGPRELQLFAQSSGCVQVAYFDVGEHGPKLRSRVA